MTKQLAAGDVAPSIRGVDATGAPIDLAALAGRVVVVRFLRHLGCPICRFELAEMARRAGEIAARGAEAVVIVESGDASVRAWAAAHAAGFRLVGDPEREAYAAWGVEPGTIAAFLAPGAAARAAKATFAGHLHGRFEGSELQLPADFVVDAQGRIAWARYGRHVGDNATLDALLTEVDAASAARPGA